MSDTPSASQCVHHPEVRAHFVCGRCQAAVCGECCYRMPEGTYLCKACYGRAEEPTASEAGAAPRLRLQLQKREPPPLHTPSPAISAAHARRCPQHPDVVAMATCQMCGVGSCITCDFLFPGNLHLCPDCATSGQGSLSPRRKKYMIASFILAGWSLVALAGVVVGAGAIWGDDPAAEMVLGFVMIAVAFLPSIIGTALAMSALRKGAANPLSVWISLILNSLVLTGFALLVLVGNLMD